MSNRMRPDQSAADLLAAADPALTITEEELTRSRQRSLSFVNSEITHIAAGGSVHDFHRAPAKRHWGRFAAAGLAAAAVAACVLLAPNLVSGQVNRAAPADQPAATATATARATAAPAPDPSATSASAGTTSPDGAVPSPPDATVPSAPDGAVPSPGPFSAVNAEDYRSESGFGDYFAGYYFASPSGNLLCGILNDYPRSQNNNANVVGCQAQSVVANLPRCDDPRGNGPFISLTTEGVVEAKCWNQGLYVLPNPKITPTPGAYGEVNASVFTRVLQYGQEIHVGTFSCQSQEKGITCREASTGHAFLASREEFAQIP